MLTRAGTDYQIPLVMPTWDQVGAIVGVSGAQAQAMLPGPVEIAELTWLLGGVPGGAFYPSDYLASFVYEPPYGPANASETTAIGKLEIMLQNGVPLEYVSAMWQRVESVLGWNAFFNGNPPWLDYETARELTFVNAPLPPEYEPPPVHIVRWINGTTGISQFVGDPPRGWVVDPPGMPDYLAPGGSDHNGLTYYPPNWFTGGALPPDVDPPAQPPPVIPPVVQPGCGDLPDPWIPVLQFGRNLCWNPVTDEYRLPGGGVFNPSDPPPGGGTPPPGGGTPPPGGVAVSPWLLAGGALAALLMTRRE